MKNNKIIYALTLALTLIATSGIQAFVIQPGNFRNFTDGIIEIKFEAQNGQTLVQRFHPHQPTGILNFPCPTKLTVKKLTGIGNGNELILIPDCNITRIDILLKPAAPLGFSVFVDNYMPPVG
ncbi:MAG: hypothetical protein AB7F19_04765 [Candidatus Babeliales bacterium]